MRRSWHGNHSTGYIAIWYSERGSRILSYSCESGCLLNPPNSNQSLSGKHRNAKSDSPADRTLRIVGGEFRGHPIDWSGDPAQTRPMKDDVRETLFNLVGGWIPGKHVFDLFAGSGAIGLESLSRGAAHATFVERHFPASRLIRRNIEALDVATKCTLETCDTFYWSRQFFAKSLDHPATPWAVFVSPPWNVFTDQPADIHQLIVEFWRAMPDESLLVVESDQRFDPGTLPKPESWRVRAYPPAQLCVWRPPGAN